MVMVMTMIDENGDTLHYGTDDPHYRAWVIEQGDRREEIEAAADAGDDVEAWFNDPIMLMGYVSEVNSIGEIPGIVGVVIVSICQ